MEVGPILCKGFDFMVMIVLSNLEEVNRLYVVGVSEAFIRCNPV